MTYYEFFLAFFVIRQYAGFCLCLQSSESESVRYLITPFPLILPLPPSHNFIHALSLSHSHTLLLPLTHSQGDLLIALTGSIIPPEVPGTIVNKATTHAPYKGKSRPKGVE